MPKKRYNAERSRPAAFGSDRLGFGSTLAVAPHQHHVFRRQVSGIPRCKAGSIPAPASRDNAGLYL